MIKQFIDRHGVANPEITGVTKDRKSQKGASAIEYVMIIAVIVIALIVAFNATGLGDWVSDTFTELQEGLEEAGGD